MIHEWTSTQTYFLGTFPIFNFAFCLNISVSVKSRVNFEWFQKREPGALSSNETHISSRLYLIPHFLNPGDRKMFNTLRLWKDQIYQTCLSLIVCVWQTNLLCFCACDEILCLEKGSDLVPAFQRGTAGMDSERDEDLH